MPQPMRRDRCFEAGALPRPFRGTTGWLRPGFTDEDRYPSRGQKPKKAVCEALNEATTVEATGREITPLSGQSPSLAAGLSRKSERSRMYFRNVLRDLCRVCRRMETSAAPFKNAWVTKPARRLWPA